MPSKQKRSRQSSLSSQPTKKPLLDVSSSQNAALNVKKQKVVRNPTTKSKGNLEGVLKPTMLLTNKGDQSLSHSSNGMCFLCFESC